jgi:hypothetical protein
LQSDILSPKHQEAWFLRILRFRELFSLVVQSMLPGWILATSNIRLEIKYR